MSNTVQITLGEDPEIDAIFAGKALGDKCEAKLSMSVIETGDKAIRLNIDKIEPEDAPEETPEEAPVEAPGDAEPYKAILGANKP